MRDPDFGAVLGEDIGEIAAAFHAQRCERGDVDVAWTRVDLAGLGAGQREQVIDQRQEALRAALDRGARGSLLVGDRVHP